MLVLAENDTVLAMNGPHMLFEAPLTNIMYLRNIMRHINSNGCLLLEDTIPFSVLRGYPKSDILSWIWELFMTCCIPQGPLYAVRSSSKHHYTFEKCYETRRQQWMYFLVTEQLISCADRVPKIWYFAWNLGVVLCRKWHGFGNKELMCAV